MKTSFYIETHTHTNLSDDFHLALVSAMKMSSTIYYGQKSNRAPQCIPSLPYSRNACNLHLSVLELSQAICNHFLDSALGMSAQAFVPSFLFLISKMQRPVFSSGLRQHANTFCFFYNVAITRPQAKNAHGIPPQVQTSAYTSLFL